ncbi:PPD7 [Symbiodinium natans]|uniref:PPD7 protein n=1 Tax=Symbiodinium natans TaxID=878477 RepID=A0A812S0W1_9DINO|nr:PPD7 [Symbiodinium natans]
MDPRVSPDLLALSTCFDQTNGASEVAQRLRVLTGQRGSARFNSEVAECLMRIKEIDGIAKVEQCRLSESGLTERSRIAEEARSQRYKHLVDVMQVSVKEGAETARQEISARAEVSKETVKGHVQIQEVQSRVQQSSSNFWQWVALTLIFSTILTGRRRASLRGGASRLLSWLPWLLLAVVGWRQTRATRLHLSQLMKTMRSLPLLRLSSLFGGGAASAAAPVAAEVATPPPVSPPPASEPSALESDRDSPKGSATSTVLRSEQEGDAPAALRRLLQPVGLDVYTERLLAEGYDTEALTMLEGTEREEMLKIIQCLPGHKVKFRKLLWRSQS